MKMTKMCEDCGQRPGASWEPKPGQPPYYAGMAEGKAGQELQWVCAPCAKKRREERLAS